MKTTIIFILICVGICLNGAEKDPLWEKRANAQIEWQKSLASLLLDEVPEAKEIIIIQRDLQISYNKIRSEKYYYLLTNHPSRIIRNQGHLQWANFKWTKRDETELSKISNEYVRLKKHHELLKSQNQGHPQWAKLREPFKRLQKIDKYQQIYKKLTGTLNEIDSALKETK